MPHKLVVTDDLPAAAERLFLELAPPTLVLAGGSTPRPIYQRLAGLQYDWASVRVFFTDERCVPRDHPDSNYRMAHETLLGKVPAQAYPFPTDDDWYSYELMLHEVFDDVESPPFDLAFLGLGADGHTASLFPGDAALDITHRWVARVLRAGHTRLTLAGLAGTRHAVYLVSGANKRDALRRVLAGEDLPPNRVHAAHSVILADPAAAP